MSKKRILSLLLCVLLLAGSTACGSDTPADTSADTGTTAGDTVPADDGTAAEVPEETETERIAKDVSGIDYAGYEFRMWNYDNVADNGWAPTDIPNDIYSAELNGDALNDAVFERNRTVEEMLNIKIVGDDKSSGEMTDGLRQSVTSGSNDVDAAFPRVYDFSSYVTNTYLLNLNNLSSFDREAPWWNTDANNLMTIQGKLLGMISDITYYDKVCTIVTYFNQKLAEDYQLGDLYQTVSDNKWTIDNLLSMAADVSADVNNDNVYDMNDAYPLSCQNDAVYYFLHGGDKRICGTDSEGKVVLTLGDESTVNVLQKIYEIMGNEKQFLNRQTHGATLNDAINMFCENRVMFLVRPIQSLFLMRNMEADFGILPVPKMTEDQKSYGSAVNPYAGTIMCFPKTVADAERSATVTEVLAWESHYSVIDPLYENILGSKLIRDDGAAQMLDIVFDTVVYDIGMIWNFGDISTKLLTNTSTDIASLLASVQKPVDAGIKTFEKVLSKID